MQPKSAALSVTFYVCIGMLFSFSASAQLIEPTRTLESVTAPKSTLTVLSEPPGLQVMLGSKTLGATPIFRAKIDTGTHVLQVGDKQTALQIAANRSIRITLFKGSFRELPEEHEPGLSHASQPEQIPPPLKSQTQPVKETLKANDPFYWPMNPHGPINLRMKDDN